MIEDVRLENFGPIRLLEWAPGPGINLIIGENGTGKTFLLKALYACVRALEEYDRSPAPKGLRQILEEKLVWTFLLRRTGDLVRKGGGEGNGEGPEERRRLSLRLDFGKNEEPLSFAFSLGPYAEREIGDLEKRRTGRQGISLFIPAKEVLSLTSAIKKSRYTDMDFSFDDTYGDLVLALENEPTQGKNYAGYAEARRRLAALLGGRIERRQGLWSFRRRKEGFRFPIELTAEGIRRIGLLDRLLGNRTLSPRSILFLDEPDAALHPSAVSCLMEILDLLARAGNQIFLATHSYFVLKKLCLIARKRRGGEEDPGIPLLSFSGERIERLDLADGMPSNPIVEESLRLYEEEVDQILGEPGGRAPGAPGAA